MGINLKEIDKKIDAFRETKEPSRILIGYKTYSKLLKEDKFLDHLTKDSNDPMIRYYQGIEIRMITEKHFFEIE
ncbi:hypothetical protein RFI36_04755 [Acinetobacter gerneri]|uniref:Uncharacterized protein n=1 Tax=Acinetobacter gerneri TaxID=202952 RepID=A0AAW8JIL8_9GAMM|nr:hypothetical protein [Acinetobacter gerneri]MDQ9009020.1 hypothetical protein [Acinetobacter gerneri]MDQ9013124.1 hypothetical protein [Acinetobacter gerneri]MDQ9024561.1 hypothetical protein [Acinetobacter gerneri]MDQ9051796.1 hypothetical protein [Acinetobacter gerneri]MDQ9059223.1 hypothetical protein [Acinetobacter gerneri]